MHKGEENQLAARIKVMTDDACPTCGPICGMREFGWEEDDD